MGSPGTTTWNPRNIKVRIRLAVKKRNTHSILSHSQISYVAVQESIYSFVKITLSHFFKTLLLQSVQLSENQDYLPSCTSYVYQSMRNLVCRRSMTGKTCLRLVGILGLPVTRTRLWQVTFVKFCSIFNDVTGKHLEIISQIVLWYENSFSHRLVYFICGTFHQYLFFR